MSAPHAYMQPWHLPLLLSRKGPHTARGATKEKAHKLDELKAKRKAKDDKKRVSAPWRAAADGAHTGIGNGTCSPRGMRRRRRASVHRCPRTWTSPTPSRRTVRSRSMTRRKSGLISLPRGTILIGRIGRKRKRRADQRCYCEALRQALVPGLCDWWVLYSLFNISN